MFFAGRAFCAIIKTKYAYEQFSDAAKLPPLQGEGGDGVGTSRNCFLMHPIPLPASPLKGEERLAILPENGSEA
jgi:hypothetical protein